MMQPVTHKCHSLGGCCHPYPRMALGDSDAKLTLYQLTLILCLLNQGSSLRG